jgi:hypothetical protein
MSNFNANDLIFNDNDELGIHTGGFSVNSIMMKTGISPIMTINTNDQLGGTKVSDLFSSDLVVPNWVYAHDIQVGGGKHGYKIDSDDENENEEIDDELHDKLLDLVRVHDNELRKKFKKTRLNRKDKKGGTRRNK